MTQIWVLNELLCWDENQTRRFLYCSFINLNFKFNTHLQGEGKKAEEAENATDSTLRYLKFNFKQSLKSWGGGTFKSPGSTNHDIRADNLTGGLIRESSACCWHSAKQKNSDVEITDLNYTTKIFGFDLCRLLFCYAEKVKDLIKI